MKKLLTSAIFVLGTASALATSGAVSAASKPTLETIQASGQLKVCFDAGYMPFEMSTKDGRYIGFDIDLGKQMARAMGVKFVPVNTAWDGIIPALQTGKCDIIMAGMTITPKRNMQVNFANPYVVIGQTAVISKKLKDKVHSYRDLNNPKYHISSKLGTTGAQAAKRYLPKAKLSLFDSESAGVIEVANGKADAFIYDMPFNAIYASQHKDQVAFLEKPFTYEPLAWAIRQNDPDFLNFLNNFLQQIKGDGTYKRIYAHWFKSNRWLKQVQ